METISTYRLSNSALGGMTKQQAGNFSLSQPETSQGIIFAGTILRLLGRDTVGLRNHNTFIMDAREHTNEVEVWNPNEESIRQKNCDGVIWSGQGMALFFPGGCGALAFHDPGVGLSGLLHTSWKTTARDIVANFLDTWEMHETDRTQTVVRILPSICGQCLTFDKPYWENHVRRWIGQVCIDPDEFLLKLPEDRLGLDLISLVCKLIRQAGYTVENEFVCTCHSNEYWCYRHHGLSRNTAFVIAEQTYPSSRIT